MSKMMDRPAVRKLPARSELDDLSDEAAAAIESAVGRLRGQPTEATVRCAAARLKRGYDKQQLLRYFLMQSQLSPRDMNFLCNDIGQVVFRRICVQATQDRQKLKDRDQYHPRWSRP